jgi:dihydroneopterin aldolase
LIATTGLKSLHIDCIVGVYEFEREQTQPIIMNIELDYDFAAAAASDAIGDAVDYDRVASGITELLHTRQFALLEAMAEETAALLFEQHALVQTVRLEIRKPKAVPAAECSFVCLERNRV